MKVLFHINENCKWKGVLDNVNNVIKICNENKEAFKIEVIANGEAVMSLKEKAAINLNIFSKINELSEAGAEFSACRNSLNKYVISQADLISFVKVVPSGIVEIVRKQEEGYSYIKP